MHFLFYYKFTLLVDNILTTKREILGKPRCISTVGVFGFHIQNWVAKLSVQSYDISMVYIDVSIYHIKERFVVFG